MGCPHSSIFCTKWHICKKLTAKNVWYIGSKIFLTQQIYSVTTETYKAQNTRFILLWVWTQWKHGNNDLLSRTHPSTKTNSRPLSPWSSYQLRTHPCAQTAIVCAQRSLTAVCINSLREGHFPTSVSEPRRKHKSHIQVLLTPQIDLITLRQRRRGPPATSTVQEDEGEKCRR